MSVEIMPLGKSDLMARIDGPHGTRPVVGIAYREADGEHFRVWDVAATRDGPVAENVTRERAKALLRQGLSVTDTCFAVGCTSLGSFSSRFTEIVGETPCPKADGSSERTTEFASP